MDPKLMKNLCFAKKHEKGLKMWANNAKAMSVHARSFKALAKPEEVKPKIPEASATSVVDWPTLPIPTSGGLLVPAVPKVSGSAGQRPRLKAGSSSSFSLPLAQGPHRCLGSTEALWERDLHVPT
ncbi:60S ribosomal protein L29-like [Pteronotus mesoamericanus]|uniref:60S ribosomal protein L29-like n=1 Tax=Pteronotus mesoamericanus TaxID=1884717 RepID=UPI0023EDD301|nr:60S ribosomal protein L29-like [Pteronotus parnellii mesoamericanus]